MAETVRILIVDDEPGMRQGAERALRGLVLSLPDVNGEVRFAVETAGTGEEALEKIGSADILLLDHKLPGMSGLEVLNHVSKQQTNVLTIMITAYASLETAITATKLGAYDFLAKPFTPEELKASVRKAAKHLVLQRHAKRLAEEKRRIRFEFISVLAHELKSPLNAIEGNLNILKDGAAAGDPATEKRMVERSLVRLDGMRKLIADLLDLTRIESGEKKRELGAVDAVEAARGAVEAVQPSARERKISVELRAPAQALLTGDRGEVEIILNNLVSNAVKYNRDGGRVDVTVEDGAAQVLIRVADTGIGMTAEEAGKVFQDFVRIKNEKTRHILGSGLGLSIVKKLAQLYEGEVSVESRPDAGSTFTVTLKKLAQKPTAQSGQTA
jgi:signal transduction histidine kinase